MALLGSLALAVPPAAADTPEQLEALSRATDSSTAGLALARRQIGEGDLLGAAATLERVIMAHPDNAEARLLHAGLLCRLDDRQGSLVEFDTVQSSEFPDQVWADATAPCDERRGNGRN